MVLSKNEIENVASHYARQYEVNDWLVNMEEIWEQHGHSHFHIYRKLCQIQNWHIDSDKNKVKAKIPRRKEHIFKKELTRLSFLKVTKGTKLTAPLRSEFEYEIMFTVIVCK